MSGRPPCRSGATVGATSPAAGGGSHPGSPPSQPDGVPAPEEDDGVPDEPRAQRRRQEPQAQDDHTTAVLTGARNEAKPRLMDVSATTRAGGGGAPSPRSAPPPAPPARPRSMPAGVESTVTGNGSDDDHRRPRGCGRAERPARLADPSGPGGQAEEAADAERPPRALLEARRAGDGVVRTAEALPAAVVHLLGHSGARGPEDARAARLVSAARASGAARRARARRASGLRGRRVPRADGGQSSCRPRPVRSRTSSACRGEPPLGARRPGSLRPQIILRPHAREGIQLHTWLITLPADHRRRRQRRSCSLLV